MRMRLVNVSLPRHGSFFDHARPRFAAKAKLALRAQTIALGVIPGTVYLILDIF
jgi:hypothetical protein